jgi:hypothetical protein
MNHAGDGLNEKRSVVRIPHITISLDHTPLGFNDSIGLIESNLFREKKYFR